MPKIRTGVGVQVIPFKLFVRELEWNCYWIDIYTYYGKKYTVHTEYYNETDFDEIMDYYNFKTINRK